MGWVQAEGSIERELRLSRPGLEGELSTTYLSALLRYCPGEALLVGDSLQGCRGLQRSLGANALNLPGHRNNQH